MACSTLYSLIKGITDLFSERFMMTANSMRLNSKSSSLSENLKLFVSGERLPTSEKVKSDTILAANPTSMNGASGSVFAIKFVMARRSFLTVLKQELKHYQWSSKKSMLSAGSMSKWDFEFAGMVKLNGHVFARIDEDVTDLWWWL